MEQRLKMSGSGESRTSQAAPKFARARLCYDLFGIGLGPDEFVHSLQRDLDDSTQAPMALPILLPQKSIPPSLRQGAKEKQRDDPFAHLEWQPKRYLTDPQPPSNEDARLQEEFIAKQALEGKIVKKTRPRRTVDYNGGMGRWILVCRVADD